MVAPSNSRRQSVAIVTGGGNGIGALVCEGLAKRGDAVFVADLSLADAERTVRSIQSHGGHAVPLSVDVTDRQSVDSMVREALHQAGQIDVLANIAGAWLRPRSVGFQDYTAISASDWEWVVDVNLTGTFNVCQAVGPVMSEMGSGRIVNMASATFYGGVAGLAQYVASKAGVIGLTRVLARELGAFGVRVNAVAPGAILTEDNPSEAILAIHREKAKMRSLKRIGHPQDVVGPVLFFASDVSDFVTGQTLIVDGGVYMN
ncbi:MAG TPA: SDR family NAD(P)-dependent oxidoreductase [Rhodothermales bacterium]|nr:SDR family NAD(P)-dependent oxidoreductase [Rhodothermales bacterium]